MTLVLGIAIGVVAMLALFLLLRRNAPAEDPNVAQLRNEMQSLRQSTENSIQNVNNAFAAQVQTLTSHVQNSLTGVTAQLGDRLDSINRQVTEQVNQSARLMNASSHTVTERISDVQTTFASLQKQVGEMTAQAQQLGELSRSVTAIEHVLRAPKMRGNFGEEQLETLLGMVFARQQYSLKYRFPSGEVADAVLFLSSGKLAIDSKFPLENFRRIGQTVIEDEKKSARKDFLRDVKKRVDEIAAKYIRPADDTLPLALMYVPAENVYYETIIRDDDDGQQLYRYCLEKHVVPVSPNSLYAYLQTVLMGLKGLQVSQRAENMARELESLKIELEKFGKAYDTVGQHIRNAGGKFEESNKLLTKVELRVESLVGNGAEQTELFAADEKALRAGSS